MTVLTRAPAVAGASGERFRAWTVSLLVVLIAMVNWADKSVLGLSEIPLSRELGMSHGTYGLVASSFFLLFSLSSVVVGLVTNRFATRWVLLALALAWSVAQVPVLAAASVGTLFASRILLGAGEGPTAGIATHAIFRWFPPARRGLPSALFATGSGLGVFAAAPILTWLIVGHGWRSAFLVLALAGLVWSVVWLLLGRDGPYLANQESVSLDQAATQRLPYRRIFTAPTWIGSAVTGFGAYWATALASAFLPAYLVTQDHYTAGQAAGVVSLYALTTVISTLVFSPLAAFLNRRGLSSRLARGGMQSLIVIVGGVALILLPYTAAHVPQLVLSALAFGLVSAVYPLAYQTTAEISPGAQRSATLTTLIAVSTLPGLIAPAISGRLIDAAPSIASGYNIAFVVAAVVLLASGVIGFLTINPERDITRLGLRDQP